MMAQGPLPGVDFEHRIFESLADQASAILTAIPGVRRATDPEDIHRMRVASRRLRIRLSLFEDFIPGKKARPWRRRLKGLTRALGEARDADVQLIFLEEYLAQPPDERERAGVKRLMASTRRQRRKLQKQVLKVLDKVEDSSILTDMRQTFQAVVDASVAAGGAPGGQPPFGLARTAIEARLWEVLAFAPFIRDPRHNEELHRMRIAAKHLRYCMEAFAQLYDGRLGRPIKTAKAIQEMLGDIHDCDVWSVLLDGFLEQETVRAREYYREARSLKRLTPGIQGLIENRRAFRARRYRAFLTYWDRHAGDWKDLLELLHAASQGVDPHGKGERG